jgi:protein-disulfide isomerase
MENKNKLTGIISLIIILIVIVSGSLYLSKKYQKQDSNKDNKIENNLPEKQSEIKPISQEDYISGNPDAEIIIIEYSDIECPYCKTYHNNLKQVMEEYGKTGIVAHVFRHLPIEQLHQNAWIEAQAVECAGKIGGNEKFWKYLNTVFEKTKSNDGLKLIALPEIAKEIEIDVEKFEICLKNNETKDIVQADFDEANALLDGKIGTPFTMFLTKDGRQTPMMGLMNVDDIKMIINTLLQETENPQQNQTQNIENNN